MFVIALDSIISDEIFWVILMVVIRDKLSENPASVTDHAVTALTLRMFTTVGFTSNLIARRSLKLFISFFG